MRVAHIITRLIVGGAQENTIATVLGLQTKPSVEVRLFSGPTTGPEGTLEPQVAGVPDLLTIVPQLIRPVRPVSDFRAHRQLVGLLEEFRPDVVHTHSGKAGFLGRLAAHRARAPVIIHTIHGPSFGPFQGRWGNLLFCRAERLAAKCTTHFVSVADAMSRQYLAAGIGHPDQYSRIFSGFPLQPYLTASNDLKLRAKFGLQAHDFILGKIARLFELKGHDDLFAIASDLVQACPNIKFLLVGGGPWRERFEQRVRALGLQHAFIFTGLVPPADIPRYIGIMDALVHLSRREGLPRALPQALAAGRPVVAYDCDGASEVCLDNETGFLVTPGDLPALTERILRLAHDPSLRQRMGERGRDLVSKWFPVDKMVDDIYDLYLRLL